MSTRTYNSDMSYDTTSNCVFIYKCYNIRVTPPWSCRTYERIVMITFFALIAIAIIIGVLFYFVKRENKNLIVDMIIYVIVASVCLLVVFFKYFYNDHTATCTITGKDRGGDSGSYRIYTSDCGTLENKDAWFRGKFDSADVWQQIPNEGSVTVHLTGLRLPLFSWFPNILEVTSVQQSS